jgi:predicted DNA-binding mobile mystery protein A
MQGYERNNLRRELDEALLPFRLVRKRKGSAKKGWVQSIRQAIGMPVDELARRMGVCRWEIHRLEDSEKNSRIMLATLSRAAKGLGCELVYALAPKEGTLEDLAAEHRRVRERALEEKREERAAQRKPWLEEIGWREKFLGSLRTIMRNEGFRIRPRKTDNGIAKQQEEYEKTMKLAAMARVMGPLMIEMKKDKEQEIGNREKGLEKPVG